MKTFLSRINNLFLSVMSVLKSPELFAVKQSQLEVSPSGSAAKPKRKNNAILMMYSGWGYYGMQRGSIFPTIEGELAKALFNCGQLSNVTSEEHRKVRFQRASKTDKSVSALGQVCSLELHDDADLLNKLNTILPENIRILDIIRVTRGFSSHCSCSHRIYDYLLPTFALSPSSLSLSCSTCWTYRVTAEQITKVNNLLEKYKGTHNFYNFTSRRLPTDKSCNRYIQSAECMPTFLLGEHQYTVIRIIGHSFMLHQIRKMIGLVLGILRGYATEDVFDIVFNEERVDIPKAPGLGLMLNQVDFSWYNKKFQNDGIHQPLDWSKYEDQRNAFMMQYVYQHIDQIETEDKSMFQWLATLHGHTYSFRDSLPPTIVSDKVSEIDALHIAASEETTLHAQSNADSNQDYDDSDECDLPVKKERMEL
ncbi:hypothetical protein MN116_005652 [Schistosoma mekongi]|uniref:Pseudouridylate synthase 1 homolog n=1 Tax=Schistosoma mekongi TaxID=38744 RepID=A0AAE1ZBQ3_SCHME|nr:hypothetical protein MN116_005652 [Schistosoma mekongi]